METLDLADRSGSVPGRVEPSSAGGGRLLESRQGSCSAGTNRDLLRFRATCGSSEGRQGVRLPLPRTLGGLTASIRHSSPEQTLAVPLLALQQMNTCSEGDCPITAVTVQIPFELAAPSLGETSGNTELRISWGTGISKSFPVSVASDNIHVLNSCDTFPQGPSASFDAENCRSIVTHADGSAITVPVVPTGEATPMSAPGLYPPGNHVIVQFNFSPNSSPKFPYYDIRDIDGRPIPVFNGLTPGQAGLYQINIRLPDRIPPVPPCHDWQTPRTLDRVRTNLTISIQPGVSVDGAAICVEPPSTPE